MNKKAEEVTLESVYKEFRQAGHTPEEAAKRVLDIQTGGMWAIMDETRIKESIQKLIERFEMKQTQPTQQTNPTQTAKSIKKIKFSRKEWDAMGKQIKS